MTTDDTRPLDEKVERFLYDLGGWSEGAVTERRRERLHALLDDAREQERARHAALVAAAMNACDAANDVLKGPTDDRLARLDHATDILGAALDGEPAIPAPLDVIQHAGTSTPFGPPPHVDDPTWDRHLATPAPQSDRHAALVAAARLALDLLPDLSVAYHQTGSIRDHADPKDRTGWNVHGIETCDDSYCLDGIAAIAALRAALDGEPRGCAHMDADLNSAP